MVEKIVMCTSMNCHKKDMCPHGVAHSMHADCKNECKSYSTSKCFEIGTIGTWSG